MSEKTYATREIHGGLDWRAISRVMGKSNMGLSPSRARGLFINTMEKFAREMLRRIKGRVSNEEAQEIAQDPSFQQSVGSILRMAYSGDEIDKMRERDMEGNIEDLIDERKSKRQTYKGKRKRPPQKIDPNNWEECEEDEFADLME